MIERLAILALCAALAACSLVLAACVFAPAFIMGLSHASTVLLAFTGSACAFLPVAVFLDTVKGGNR